MSDAESKSESPETAAATAAPPEGEDAATESTPKQSAEAPAEEEASSAEAEAQPEAAEPEAAQAEPEAAQAEPETAKAEPAKAEPAKAEPAKAEPTEKSTKRPPKPKKPEPAPPPAKKAPEEKAKEKERAARIGEEEEKTAQELLFENLPMVIVVCLIFSLIPVWWVYHGQTSTENRQQAWTDYGDARKKDLAQADFERLVKEHQGTTAAPYLKIEWAAKLYETGERAKVEQALKLWREIKRDHSDLPLVNTLFEERIKTVEAELNDPRAVWAPAGVPASAGSTAPATTAGQ